MECPYCQAELEKVEGRCPSCKRKLYAVTEADFAEREEDGSDAAGLTGDRLEAGDAVDMRELIVQLEDRFVCVKCDHRGGNANQVAMTGTGVSKLLDVQHHHYLYLSCERCGYVEVYDPKVLLGYKPGALGTLLDILF